MKGLSLLYVLFLVLCFINLFPVPSNAIPIFGRGKILSGTEMDNAEMADVLEMAKEKPTLFTRYLTLLATVIKKNRFTGRRSATEFIREPRLSRDFDALFEMRRKREEAAVETESHSLETKLRKRDKKSKTPLFKSAVTTFMDY